MLDASASKNLPHFSPFPPKIFLHLRAHAGHEVVEVHHHVDAHVEEATEGGVATPHKPMEEM